MRFGSPEYGETARDCRRRAGDVENDTKGMVASERFDPPDVEIGCSKQRGNRLQARQKTPGTRGAPRPTAFTV
jgi:hypothetical protein